MLPTKVVCIKVGIKYGPEYVNRLFRMVNENTTFPHEFLCLTDNARGLQCPWDDVRCASLEGWWAKLVLFKPHPALYGCRTIFLDLDTVILGNIDFLFDYKGDFALLRDFYFPERQYGSAIMSISDDFKSTIYRTHAPLGYRGDQSWIQENVKSPDFWQDLYPGRIASYKVHCERRIPEEAAIVCFHGRPRIEELPVKNQIRQAWERSKSEMSYF